MTQEKQDVNKKQGVENESSSKNQEITPEAVDRARKIHPVIMYPYSHPKDITDLEALYDNLIKGLDKQKYCRPITVMNQQTYYRNYTDDNFNNFLRDHVEQYSDVIDAWCVDTCQMWLTGLGKAFDKGESEGGISDVYWLIPGDFNYASNSGQQVIDKYEELPKKVYDGNCQLCLGEITVEPNSSKQLIDTYGTYGLLYNWFPAEAQGIRKITDKPRSEFFAISHSYLGSVLRRRWYAYEQTIVILLHGMQGDQTMLEISKIPLGDISDEPQGRESLAQAIQQVERTERVLKLYWRERHERQDPTWPDKFRNLDAQSEKIRGAALVILEQILR